MKLLFILLGFLSLIFFSACKKEGATSTTPPPVDTTGNTATMNINLTYSGTTVTGNFELVIAEPGGKLLLDTIAPVQTAVKAALKTNFKLLDVSYIYVFDTTTGSSQYTANVYKSVDLSGWNTVNPGSIVLDYPNPAGSNDVLYITNYPAAAITDGNVYNSFMFNNGVINSFSNGTYDPAGNTLRLSYQRRTGANNYLVLPHLGLYKLFVPNGVTNDTLDYSSLDTAIAISFARPSPSPFSLIYPGCVFTGIPDSTNLASAVSLLDLFNPLAPVTGDLQMPKTPMQKYEISISAKNANNDYAYYYGYVSTIPAQLPFADPSSFTVGSQQNDNFSVTFNNPGTTSFCMTTLTGTHLRLNYFTSPDSIPLHPVTFFTSQKSKLLNGVPISDLAMNNFVFTNVPGFVFADYFAYVCNPSKIQTRQMTTYTSYTRIF
jgi:hypothetical protein